MGEKPTTIAFCGSRSLVSPYDVEQAFVRCIERIGGEFDHLDFATYVHGGAKGVDTLVNNFLAREALVACEVIRPDYAKHGKNAAPFIRNQEIVDRADVLLAIWDGQSKGTAHTIGLAARKGIPVVVEVVNG